MKHYRDSRLPLQNYLMCLAYEDRDNCSVKELMELLSLSERTVIKIRMGLVEKGYLTQYRKGLFRLTDKLYPNNPVNKPKPVLQ